MKNQAKKIHFIGIKGVGMAALAIFAKEKGYQVTGADVEEIFVTDEILERAKISVSPFDVKNLASKPDLVVVSAAFDKANIEVREARKKHLELKTYSEALAMVSSASQVIAVAGIHGKTTTAALISFLLARANLDPSYIIGAGLIPSLGLPGHNGRGDYFVLEADEYRKSPEDNNSKFFDLSPAMEVITSIEMDHPDIFPTVEKVYETFYKFACRTPRTGFIVLCTDYQKSKKLIRSLADRNFETYGFQDGALWQIIEAQENENYSQFYLLNHGQKLGPFRLKIPGIANILNAAAAIVVLIKIGLEEKILKKYLPQFSGVKRRFEKIGETKNLIIIDDYAHHPHSIALTLAAARNKFPGRKIWCIFQPHTYSRTKELLTDFSLAFKDADRVIITEIYASARESDAFISGEDLAASIRQHQKQVKFIELPEKIVQEIGDNIDEPTVLITMGAGNIYKISKQILDSLK